MNATQILFPGLGTMVRNSDPDTSVASASADATLRSKQRQDVYAYIKSRGNSGSTDFETGQALGILRTSAGKRRKELETAGLIIFTKERRTTDTGSTAIVWKVKA